MEISGLIVLVGAMILSRIISMRGYRRLREAEQRRLVEAFAQVQLFSLLPLLVLVGGFFILTTQTALSPLLLTLSYFATLVLYAVVRAFLHLKKLRELALPSTFARSFLLSQLVSVAGTGWFFFLLLP